METTKKTYRLDDKLLTDLKAIAEDTGRTETDMLSQAIKLFRDYHYMSTRAAFINDELINILQASYKMAENAINNKTNRVLSELAIQAAIQNQILAANLDVSQSKMDTYRLRALDFLKEHQRVFRLEELL